MCPNATVVPLQEAGPSIKRTKTSDDSGLDMDNAAENGGGDSVNDGGASEIELVFRPHPTLMEKDDGHNRWRLLPRPSLSLCSASSVSPLSILSLKN